jgi:hypothetical protein
LPAFAAAWRQKNPASPQMETAAPKPERPNQFEAEFGSTGRSVVDAIGDLGHLVLDRAAQQVGGDDDAGRDE